MELRIVGCTGSMSGPHSSASCYLVRARGMDPVTGVVRWWNLALDLGPGSFGQLWRHIDPVDLDAVVFSHCHADHMADVISLHVHRRWGPAKGRAPIVVAGPAGTIDRIRDIDGCGPGEDYAGEFRVQELIAGQNVQIGPLSLVPSPAWHSVPAFGVRISGPDEADPFRTVTLFYTGDTDECDTILEGARGVDLLLTEVGFTRADTARGIHMDGERAGRLATRAEVSAVVATHIQPWTPVEVALEEVRRTWSGPLVAAQAGQCFTVGRSFGRSLRHGRAGATPQLSELRVPVGTIPRDVSAQAGDELAGGVLVP
ncbi:MBL fold metallo-hydrolase [Schaalia sp. 19OD2882]|uniref:MBL fold metallo-hydrolase n=1 Tax=Schaalia sp. 19OD2882 TaxID=2794089 RepID=UPI001C1EF98C|nr:MBL fold metallo-hydrolase [Schaalia sp. 19OD2882]